MNLNKPKAIVMVTAVSVALGIRDIAKSRGYKVIGYQSLPREFLEELPLSYRPPYLKDDSFYDFMIYEENANVAAEILKGLDLDIRAVIPCAEGGVFGSDTLADILGVRCNDPKLISARRDKIKMKEAVQSKGLRVAKFKSVVTHEELRSFAEEISYPVVLKPPTGVSMYKFAICNNIDEACRAFDSIYHTDDSEGRISSAVDVEEYIGGFECAVDVFADGKEIFPTDCWRYNRIDLPQAPNQYYDIYMVSMDDPALAEAREYAVEICKAVGIRYGAAHPELKVDEKGPVMMEVGARLAGCKMPTMCKELSNFDPITSMFEVYCGEPLSSRRPIKYKGYAWIAFCPTAKSGKILGFKGLEEIKSLPSYHSHFLSFNVGDILHPTVDLWGNPLCVWLTHKDPCVLRRDAEIVHSAFDIVAE